MNALIMAGQLILSLAILVTLHELGHFLAARAFGIKVEKFYLFFDAWGIKLFSIKRGDTEYGIGWLPLGGYVKIAGMIDESMDTEAMKAPAQPWEFRSKPRWQRLIVMLGGVTVNAILAIFIFAMIAWSQGENYLPIDHAKYGVAPLEVGRQVGFKPGDVLVAVNGKPIKTFDEAINPEAILADKPTYTILRNSEKMDIVLPVGFLDSISDKKGQFLTPRFKFTVDSVLGNGNEKIAPLQKGDKITAVNDTAVEFYDEFTDKLAQHKDQDVKFSVLRGSEVLSVTANVDKSGKIGVQTISDIDYDTLHFGFFESFGHGIKLAKENISTQLKFFGKIFKGEADVTKSMSGPVGIAKLFGAHWDWLRFWNLTGLISIILAFMNILPIPALDGGHVLFLLIEMVIRRPLPEKFMQAMQVVGMVILIALMAFVWGNDLWRELKNMF